MSKSKRVGSHYKGRKYSRKHVSRKHSRKHLSKKFARKQKKRRIAKRTRKMRGGFGPPACPFVPPKWNAVTGGNFFAKGTPIGVGGTSPFFGNINASPQTSQPFMQKGGKCPTCPSKSAAPVGEPSTYSLLPQSLVNAYRLGMGGLGNTYLQYQGLAPNPDIRPEIQQQMQA